MSSSDDFSTLYFATPITITYNQFQSILPSLKVKTTVVVVGNLVNLRVEEAIKHFIENEDKIDLTREEIRSKFITSAKTKKASVIEYVRKCGMKCKVYYRYNPIIWRKEIRVKELKKLMHTLDSNTMFGIADEKDWNSRSYSVAEIENSFPIKELLKCDEIVPKTTTTKTKNEFCDIFVFVVNILIFIIIVFQALIYWVENNS